MNDIPVYVTCPLDVSHRILRNRLQTHLYKCYKNYPKNTKIKCIYNVTHIFDIDEYEQHLAVCPNSGTIQCYNTLLGPDHNVGIAIQDVCNLETNVTEDMEDWFGNNPTYNPLSASEKKIVIRPAIAMSKSEKKKFREYERQRLLSLEKEINEKSINKQGSAQREIGYDEPLRIPKNIAKAVSCDVSTSTIDLTSRLKDISIDSNNGAPDSENSRKLNISTNTSNNKITTISHQNNNSQPKQTKNMQNVKKDTCTLSQNMKMKDKNLKPTNLKTCVNTLENRNGIELGVQRGILHGEPKKVSTGRGFILACQSSRSNIKRSNSKASSTSDHDCDKS